MISYSSLQLLAWLAVGTAFFLFAATAGFDFGAGMLARFIGKTDSERRVVINTVGPTWDGNQVWLIFAGGALFAIWPRAYAAAFSGLYFAILLVLWSLFLRPVSFEYRSKLTSAKWRNFWDWMLFFGSFLPPLLLGVAVGNLFLGLPIHYDPISLRFYYGKEMADATAFSDLFTLLRPFALLVGLVSVVMMLMHGAAYLCLRTAGLVAERARKVLILSALLFLILFSGAGYWIAYLPGWVWTATPDPMLHPLAVNAVVQTGAWLQNYMQYPWMMIAPFIGLTSPFLVLLFACGRAYRPAFIFSVLAIAGTLATWALSMYPFVMPSSIAPSQSLTLFNATSSPLSLVGILITTAIMLPIIFIYTAFVYRKMWGRDKRLNVEAIEKESHLLY